MHYAYVARRWAKLNGSVGCPAEDDDVLNLLVKVFHRGDILRQRKSGTVTERKWLKTEVKMTARDFMFDFKLQYEAQAKREFMGKWQANEDRAMEAWCIEHPEGYVVKIDWLQNPEMGAHRELQSDHWYCLLFVCMILFVCL